VLTELPRRMTRWAADRGFVCATEGSTLVIRGHQLDCRIQTRAIDLGSLDDESLFVGRHLVTASALLDLVSRKWIRRLAALCRAHAEAALFALTYNGQSDCDPEEPEDDAIRDL